MSITDWLRQRFAPRGQPGPISPLQARPGYRPALSRALGTDRNWRPLLWDEDQPISSGPKASGSQLSPGVMLFHDGAAEQLRLLRGGRNAADAFGVILEQNGFAGSFQSLVFDLPPRLHEGLKPSHILRLDLALSMPLPENLPPIYARLNLRHGPNTEEIVLRLDVEGAGVIAEFDLSHLPINLRRIDKIWLDLIIEGDREKPRDLRLEIEDVILSRHPRAAL